VHLNLRIYIQSQEKGSLATHGSHEIQRKGKEGILILDGAPRNLQ